MHTIPEIVPLAELQARIAELLQLIQHGPVVLTQGDHAAAVLVSPEIWNDLTAELEELRDTVDGIHAYEAYQQTPEAVKSWRDIRAGLVAEGRLDE